MTASNEAILTGGGSTSSFSRTNSPGSTQFCKSPCIAKKESNDQLSSAVKTRIESYTRRPEQATGKLTSDDSPNLLSPSASECEKKAYTLGPTLRRFNRYNEALPYANAALNVNELGVENDSDKNKKKLAEQCMTRLPDSAVELNAELRLPPGTIRDEDLVNDKTGFRAAMYRSEETGRLILVARDTDPKSLVDWRTNTDNGQGRDTDQYSAMRILTGKLAAKNVDFDIAGYSKGGGLAQEGGLMSEKSRVMVFNSAGLNEASLARTGNASFNSLQSRTSSFNAEGEFLTYMNDTTNPDQQLVNARFLRKELAGEGAGVNPMNIKYTNAEFLKAKSKTPWYKSNPEDKGFDDKEVDGKAVDGAKTTYLADLDNMIAAAEEKQRKGEPFRLFPPVQAGSKEVVPNSVPWFNSTPDENSGPSFTRQVQHLMSNVTDGLNTTVAQDKKILQNFIKTCG